MPRSFSLSQAQGNSAHVLLIERPVIRDQVRGLTTDCTTGLRPQQADADHLHTLQRRYARAQIAALVEEARKDLGRLHHDEPVTCSVPGGCMA